MRLPIFRAALLVAIFLVAGFAAAQSTAQNAISHLLNSSEQELESYQSDPTGGGSYNVSGMAAEYIKGLAGALISYKSSMKQAISLCNDSDLSSRYGSDPAFDAAFWDYKSKIIDSMSDSERNSFFDGSGQAASYFVGAGTARLMVQNDVFQALKAEGSVSPNVLRGALTAIEDTNNSIQFMYIGPFAATRDQTNSVVESTIAKERAALGEGPSEPAVPNANFRTSTVGGRSASSPAPNNDGNSATYVSNPRRNNPPANSGNDAPDNSLSNDMLSKFIQDAQTKAIFDQANADGSVPMVSGGTEIIEWKGTEVTHTIIPFRPLDPVIMFPDPSLKADNGSAPPDPNAMPPGVPPVSLTDQITPPNPPISLAPFPTLSPTSTVTPTQDESQPDPSTWNPFNSIKSWLNEKVVQPFTNPGPYDLQGEYFHDLWFNSTPYKMYKGIGQSVDDIKQLKQGWKDFREDPLKLHQDGGSQ